MRASTIPDAMSASSIAFLEPSEADSSNRRRYLGSSTAFLADHSLVLLTCVAFTVLLVDLLPHVMSTDGWLALLDGRSIVRHGLPHTNTMTLVAQGHGWVDQQWLGQLALYGLYLLGGLKLVLGVNLALVASAYALATAYASRRSNSTMVAVVAALAFLPIVISSAAVRTQSFVYLPFVFLVAQVLRRELETWRVVALLALLGVWANVHGSVVLAAGIILLRGVVEVTERKWTMTTLLLVVGPILAIFASPYALDLPGYYHATAFNSSFGRYLQQWAPSTLSPLTVPLYVLLLVGVWTLGRCRGVYTRFESLLMVVSVLAGLLAVRHWPFAALIMIMLLPHGLSTLRPRSGRAPSRVAAAVVAAACALAALLAVTVLMRPTSAFTKEFSPRLATVVAHASSRAPGPIYASVRYADWLMWARPSLVGRLRFDARYELTNASTIERLVLFRLGAGVDHVLRANRILVLDPGTESKAIAAIRGRVRVLYQTPQVFVAEVPQR
jgi:hypothetical protein